MPSAAWPRPGPCWPNKSLLPGPTRPPAVPTRRKPRPKPRRGNMRLPRKPRVRRRYRQLPRPRCRPKPPWRVTRPHPWATSHQPSRRLTIRTMLIRTMAGRPTFAMIGAPAGLPRRQGAGGSRAASGADAAFCHSGRRACLAILVMDAASGTATSGAATEPSVLEAIRGSGTTPHMEQTAFSGHRPGRAVRWHSGLTGVRRARRL